jgi:hypothetical protein
VVDSSSPGAGASTAPEVAEPSQEVLADSGAGPGSSATDPPTDAEPQEDGQGTATAPAAAAVPDQSAAGQGGSAIAPVPVSTTSLVAARRDHLVTLVEEFIKTGPSVQPGLGDVRLGTRLLIDWMTRRQWVLERSEQIAASADDWSARAFWADLQVKGFRPEGTDYDRFLPLATLPLQAVREVRAQDANSTHISTLARVEQEQVVKTMLEVARMAFESEPQADEILKELTTVFDNQVFVCLRTEWGNGRRLVRIEYQQAVARSATRPAAAVAGSRRARLVAWAIARLQFLGMQLGMRPSVWRIDLPDLAGADSWQFNVTPPDGAELQTGRLRGGATDTVVVSDTGRQVTLSCGSDSGVTALEAQFRVGRQWRSWTALNALMITALLFVGAFRIGFVTGHGSVGQINTRDLTAAFLLGINGAFAGILARPSQDALASTILSGIRFAICILGILAFVAVASLAFGPSGTGVEFSLWFSMALAAGTVSLFVLGGAGLLDRRRLRRSRSGST